MVNLKEAIANAIKMEREGYDIYMGAAQKTRNKLGQSTFKAVADKELDHIRAIECFGRKLSGKEAMLGIEIPEKVDYIRVIMQELKAEIEERVSEDSDLKQAYEIAMKLEKNSYDLYQQLSGEVTDPQAKDFFRFLMKQENIHYELFQETLQYLDRPGDWFREKERWIVEG